MGDQAYASSKQEIGNKSLSSSVSASGEAGAQTIWGILNREPNPFLKELIEHHNIANADPDACFALALSSLLSGKLSSSAESDLNFFNLFIKYYQVFPHLSLMAQSDLHVLYDRNPAVHDYGTAFLNFKGYHALQCYRVAHTLWIEKQETAARFIQSLISERWAIDIHPAAVLGERLILDHGTGIVIGETARVEDDVVLFQGVTLGGTGKESGKRHPTVYQGSIIGAGSKVLGAIEIGRGAKVGAGSVVVKNVPAFTSVFGNPAQVVGRHTHLPALTFDQSLPAIDYIL
ncbi:serine O-acetyltransferase [Acetobacter sp. P1H12_c]|uniref:serine O-acetyltransferase n=1 Tax=Acetobacter sp. P1H12_c TaxID=2762621 RepID=UPI001C03CC08|nr:serine O-acetyltransferase [Acetobacter sp. P1H12_c]